MNARGQFGGVWLAAMVVLPSVSSAKGKSLYDDVKGIGSTDMKE